MAGWDACVADLLTGRPDANQQVGASAESVAEAPAEAGQVADEADAPWNSRKSRHPRNRKNRFGGHVLRAALHEVSLETPEQGERQVLQQGHGQQYAIVNALQRGAAGGASFVSHAATGAIQSIMSVGTHLRQKVALLAAKHFGWQTEKSAAALSGPGDEASHEGKLALLDEDSCPVTSAEVLQKVSQRLLFSFWNEASDSIGCRSREGCRSRVLHSGTDLWKWLQRYSSRPLRRGTCGCTACSSLKRKNV